MNKPISNLNIFEKKVYSQNGEDGIIEAIFNKIGTTNRFYVEFGVGSAWSPDGSLDANIHGLECNTRLLQENGWTGLLMNGRGFPKINVKEEFITAENVNELFTKYEVPTEPDLLSIDIDFNDYYIWKSLKDFRPRVVIIEYNASIPPTESKVVKYESTRRWDGTNYFGASLLAYVKLAKHKGYTLVACDNRGINAFFVRNDLIDDHFLIRSIEEVYKPPKYGVLVDGKHIGHSPSKEEMINI